MSAGIKSNRDNFFFGFFFFETDIFFTRSREKNTRKNIEEKKKPSTYRYNEYRRLVMVFLPVIGVTCIVIKNNSSLQIALSARLIIIRADGVVKVVKVVTRVNCF